MSMAAIIIVNEQLLEKYHLVGKVKIIKQF